jgi:hypothetical protein
MQHYKSRALHAVQERRHSTRTAVSTIEMVAGAAIAGYVDATMPTVAGVPSSAGVGIALAAVGFGMNQKDLTALGTGMIAGYAYSKGGAWAVSHASTTK